MNPRELVEGAIREYKEEIIPTLDERDYTLAAVQMNSLYLSFNDMDPNERRFMIGSVKSALNFMGSMGLLVKRLKENPPCPERIENARRYFESFAAQTSLPLS